MSYTSGFFDAVDLGGGDYDREYSAAVFAHYFSLLVKNGVFPDPSTGMQVKASASPDMHVSVQPGSGWVNGYYITVPENGPEVLTVPTANPSLSRIDSVIMGLNYVEREIQLYIKSGAVSASPSAVSLQRDNDLYEMELAQITVAAGVASISQANITDMRQNTSRCGIVKGTIDQIDTTDLFAQYNDAFQTWFADIQAQLSGDVATNLQNQINSLKSDKVNVSDKASTAQAEAGTDNTKWMTPALVKSWTDKTLLPTVTSNVSRVAALETLTANHTKELNRQAYDLYTLWLKDYYLNGSAWSPQALGAKAILFDGFVDSNYISSVYGKIQTQQILFPNLSDSAGIVVDGTTAAVGSQQSNTASPSVSGMRLNYKGGGKNNYNLAGMRVTAPAGFTITNIVVNGKSGGFSRTRFRYFYTSTDGSTFALDSSGTSFLDEDTEGSWSWSKVVSGLRSFEFWVDMANQSGSGQFEGHFTVTITYNKVPSWNFNSIEFSLPQSFKKAKLFLSASSFDTLTILPKFGTLSATVSQVSSRADPMFSGFTEREFDISAASVQSKFSLRLTTQEGITTSVKLKRYGVYFIE